MHYADVHGNNMRGANPIHVMNEVLRELLLRDFCHNDSEKRSREACAELLARGGCAYIIQEVGAALEIAGEAVPALLRVGLGAQFLCVARALRELLLRDFLPQ